MTDQTPSLDSLLPCALCGAPGATIGIGDVGVNEQFYPVCCGRRDADGVPPERECLLTTPPDNSSWFHTRSEAIAAWNTRAPIASERAKQEAGGRAKFPRDLLKQLVIAHFNEDSRKDLLFTRWKDGIDVERTTYSVEALVDDILAWQAASKPAAVNVEKAAEEIGNTIMDTLRAELGAANPPADRSGLYREIATLLRKHLTEAPALSEEEREFIEHAKHRDQTVGLISIAAADRRDLLAIIDRTYPLTSPEGSGAKEGE